MIPGHGTRETQWLCPSTFHDLAEPEPLETEAAPGYDTSCETINRLCKTQDTVFKSALTLYERGN